MKKYLGFVATFAIVTVSFGLSAYATEKVSQGNKARILDNATVEKMIEINKSDEMQVLLVNLRGEWNYTVTVWTEQNSEPQESSGITINEVILDNRFISMKSSGIINFGGHYMPFEANGLMGYDNVKKVFTSVWADTLNPGMMMGTGTFDSKNNLIKENGDYTSAASGVVESYRSELQFTDNENYKRVVFSKDKSGKEFKTMEFVYSRKQ